MSKVIKYSNEEQYNTDFKYWSNSCGELHHFGQEDITEDELPEELKPIYKEYWEEDKDGHYTYLAQYKGMNGIALVDEYYETCEGKPTENNYAQASKAAKLISECNDCTVLLAEGLGYFDSQDGNASELVVFMPATISKERFDQISKRLMEVAYSRETA